MPVNLVSCELGVNAAEGRGAFVSAHVTVDSFALTHQVLPQLFVVGDDAIMDDDKRCESTSKHIRQKRPNINFPDDPVNPPMLSWSGFTLERCLHPQSWIQSWLQTHISGNVLNDMKTIERCKYYS